MFSANGRLINGALWSENYILSDMTYKDYLQALLAYSSEKAQSYLDAFKSRNRVRSDRNRVRSEKLYTLLFEWDMAEEACCMFRNQIRINHINLDDPMPS